MSYEALDDYEADDIDIDDAIELVQEGADEDGEVVANAEDWISVTGSALIFREPVVIEGDLSFPAETYSGVTVIFEKGLAVSGTIVDAGGDDGVVVVLGDLECKNLAAQVNWLVSGDVKVEATAFGFGTSDYQLEYDGEGSCTLLVTSGYSMDLGADETVDAEDDPTLMDEACLEDDEIVFDSVVARLRQDLPIVAL